MDDNVYRAMIELCTSIGAAKFNGFTHNEEEALLYEQLCRTITKQAKINELAIDVSMDDIKEQFPEPKHPEDEEPGAPV